ncbi:LysM peptidoglycan-binding domain-containing protein [Micromonospora andamanensis]|uniref:LysM domain-containing protein n=1 Tax=Micromonospora andamanensis TaxID=1287068 RepID=A0ABQ4I2Y0_9ACTN|nr:LysM peptidoglycan-binding domain-containing protein [Micromonospora andamanensis]GIJ12241.1 hypothetical protein Van01_54550 [Micromonospora andamanensis]
MAPTAPMAKNRRPSQILTGLGALAAMLLIVALPLLLLWAAGNPLPDLAAWATQTWNDPGASLHQLWQAVTTRDDGSLFIHALTLLGWIAIALAGWGWLSFLVALTVEIPTQIRSRRTGGIPPQPRRLPGMRLQQRAAAFLVAAAIGVFAAPALSSASVSTAPGPAPTAITANHSAEDARTSTSTREHSQPTHGYVDHRVGRGESLLDIADRYNVPWKRIAEATYGIDQPDGRQLQPGSTRVYPEWTVRVPVSGTGQLFHKASTQGAAEAATSEHVYTVVRNDWLYYVAERFLGNGDRYPEIAELNPDLKAKDSRFPDHIVRGQQIRLPSDAHDRGVRDHARGRLASDTPIPQQPAPSTDLEAPAPQPIPEPSATASEQPATPEPSSPAPAPPAELGTDHSTTENPEAGAHDRPSTDEDDDSNAIVTVTALTSASLVAALVLTTVRRLRRQQRQHRRPGRRLPHPRNGAIEKTLLVAEQPADVDRLDTALRSLTQTLSDRDPAELPDVTAAAIHDGTINLILAHPEPHPPAPWTADGTHWTLPTDASLTAAEGQLAPLPILVAVGSEPGRHLMLDLERLGSLTIGGDAERALALLRYIASEAACNRWSDDVEVILAGFPVDQAEQLIALNPDRIRAVSNIAETTARLRRRAVAITSALRHADVSDTLHGRIADVGDAWAPQLLLVADTDEQARDGLAELGNDLDNRGRCAVAVVTIAKPGQSIGPNNITVDSDATLHVALPFLQTTAIAAGLPAAELEPLAEIMRQARAALDEPTPVAAETESWATDTDAAGGLLPFAEDLPDPDDEKAQRSTSAEPERRPSSILHIPHQPLAAGLATTATQRAVTAAARQRRKQADPRLDADLDAWQQHDRTRPRVGILGPVTVDAPGAVPDQRRRFHGELIVYLAQRGARGATREQLTEAMWPDQQVKDTSRRVAITRARRWLGETPDGSPWLPEMGPDRVYRLEEGYLLDWHLFKRLRSRGEAHGPAGIRDLRAALDLVRGVPLDGADRAYAAGARNPYTWLAESDIYPGHITSAIVDTAHRLATMYLDASDTTNARWAVQQAWAADPHRGDDGPWHDLMRAAYIEGHSAELRNLLGELMSAREAEVPEDLAPDTYAWLLHLLPDVLGVNAPVG